jgi:hypothetical protein
VSGVSPHPLNLFFLLGRHPVGVESIYYIGKESRRKRKKAPMCS